AAITFTEKAAAELRDRVRRELETRARNEHLDDTERARCNVALDELDDAAICTLHAFAQRILTAFPVEAGLPPHIEVHDEVSARLRAAVADAARIELLLADKPSFRVRIGSKKNWPDIEGLRTRIYRLDDERDTLASEVTDAALRHVASFLATRTAQHADERRA